MTEQTLPPFVPGLDLCESLFRNAVEPIMAAHFPSLSYAAGHLGRGSDVVGFDTPQSRDHDWGPKATLFVAESDYSSHHERILSTMAAELPTQIDGYATHFNTPDVDGGTLAVTPTALVHHGVTVTTVKRFSHSYLGVDATDALPDHVWLRIPSQRLRTIRAGRVFADFRGELRAFCERLRWYPHHVWLYRMASAWRRVDQEEPFMARCGDVGDDLGSRLVAARQMTELMRLAFLLEREYAPYMKWFGSAFARLRLARVLGPLFHEGLVAVDWRGRESALNQAYVVLGEAHNALGVTAPVDVKLSHFHTRPYLVPHSGRFVDALEAVRPPDAVHGWPEYVGGVDQFVDSTDVLDRVERMHAIGSVFGEA